MRKIKIVADSSCDLLTLKQTEFACVPMKVITADREFTDDASLDTAEMIEFLDGYKGKSNSSCPNTDDWLNAFGDADDVFCVTITGALSGSYNSACVAKNKYETENKGKRVFVLDTLSAGPEITLIVEKLAEYAEGDLTYESICERITAYAKSTGLSFMLKSLKTFANNGRVSPIVAKLAGVAGIYIVGKASAEGTLEPMHKCRGEKRSLEAIVADLKAEGFKGGRISIGHSQNEQAASRLKKMILSVFENASIEIHKLRGLCSFYAEKGGLLVGFEKA